MEAALSHNAHSETIPLLQNFRSGPYDAIVALIWDEGRRTEEHASLRSALRQIDGVHDAVIIARPSRMA
jgi:hypothetical protein